jgi:uncharacterized protein YdhG (YjbR/CyaY superfamily)
MKTETSSPAKNVEEYIYSQPEAIQILLEKLRSAIKAAAPKAEEVISYQIPSYKYNGALVHFAAFEKHCSFIVVNKNILKIFEKELRSYKTSGTTIHFTPENPIPAALVQKIVKIRIKENEERVATKSSPKGKQQTKSSIKNK